MGLTQVFNIDAAGNSGVTGPLTDTQIRATPLPISGALTDTQLRATPVPISGALTDTQLRATPVAVSGTVTANAVTSATGTLSSVAASAASSTVLAANASRKGFSIYNDSTAILKIAFAATASATAFTVLMQPNAYFENNTLYTGIITGIWATATGNARVTELT